MNLRLPVAIGTAILLSILAFVILQVQAGELIVDPSPPAGQWRSAIVFTTENP